MSLTKETATALVEAIKRSIEKSDAMPAERAKSYAEALTLTAPLLAEGDSKDW